MRRICLAGCLAALLFAATGCTMCDHPYDYCGPTFTGECGQTCNPLARAGSVLSPPIEITTSSSGTASGGDVQPQPDEKAAPDVPAVEEPPPATESRSATPYRASRTKPTTTAGRWTARTASPPPM